MMSFTRRPANPSQHTSVQVLSPSEQHLLASARTWKEDNLQLRKKISQLQQHAANQGVAAASARARSIGSRRDFEELSKFERLRAENDELTKRNARLSEQVSGSDCQAVAVDVPSTAVRRAEDG